ncbi:glycosyltransferase [Tanticharoenia sakaeratensis]|uniref:Glycosyltransferase n=1 Tax=Tanticharoenia sakaeratensis NBRC 103193 TaxID=1231623 RepID=A0A0D6MMH2_9PROT|nr:glycosyltransferase [Tanticharoenia sakaeratensis]GAN54869.1 glycosyltransferase [Tanticharoenia sakaeratensis NBRC 103193]GBQ21330.1 glycosyltransferase [Tanticharoenia sakaeratensis NBRC 103193]
MSSRISGVEMSHQADSIEPVTDLLPLFGDLPEAVTGRHGHEYLPVVNWIARQSLTAQPVVIAGTPDIQALMQALPDLLEQPILDRRCEIVTDRTTKPLTLFWVSARDLKIPGYYAIWRARRDSMSKNGLMIVTGPLTLAADILDVEERVFIVSDDLAIVAVGSSPPPPFAPLCSTDSPTNGNPVRASYRHLLGRTLLYWRQYSKCKEAQSDRNEIFTRANTELVSNRALASRVRSLEAELKVARTSEGDVAGRSRTLIRDVVAAARAERHRRLAAEAELLQANDELAALRSWADAVTAETARREAARMAYVDVMRHHEQALDALRTFVNTPASRARRVARALRAPFVPFIPDTPPLPETDALPLCPVPAVRRPLPDHDDQNIWDTWFHALDAAPDQAPAVAAPEPALSGSNASRRNILFIAGEPDTPGVAYRCDRNAAAARDAGYEARVIPCALVNGDDMDWAQIVVLWRVEFSGHVDTLLRLAEERDAVTVFDADDIVFMPHLARVDIIDGIRSIGATEERIERCFADMRRTMMRCDMGFTTTRELVQAMHLSHPLVHLVPNTFDEASLALARSERRQRPAGDPLVRIIYATGSRTHQRDFAQLAPVLASVLQARPQARLVLFREAGTDRPVLIMDEFPALIPVADRIEWRDMVSLARLPAEYARVDIAIAPLETGNVFCEAKSEIKYFEAALASVPSIVSPTGPFRRSVRDGETGILASSTDDWAAALLMLIDDPDRRARMGRDAYHDILGPFGPWMQAQRMRTILGGLQNDTGAADAGEITIARAARPRCAIPVVPDSERLFFQDRFGEARVTVVITCFNYADYVLDALDSVQAQTLDELDLIVVDDGSTDGSVERVRRWMELHADRFNRLLLVRSVRNAGLGGARNIGMDAVETPFAMQLDADNRLLPPACERLLAATTIETAFVYPTLQAFDASGRQADGQAAASRAPIGDLAFHPLNMVSGNHVDAMALVAKWAWAAVGGYYVARDAMGWEDYDLWCSFAERGLLGHHVDEVLAEYRMHAGSMTNAVTERSGHKARVVALIERRHPWTRLVAAEARLRVAAGPADSGSAPM